MRSAVGLLLVTCLSGCTFTLDGWHQYRAERLIAQQDYASALPILQNFVDDQPDTARALQAARTGARVAHLDTKNYPLAVKFYRFLVLKSEDPGERKSAQRAIAHIYFENLLDYDQAIAEFEKLLKLDNTPEEAFRYRLNLAKSQLQLNNVEQALTELNVLLEKKPGEEQVFDIKMLKANTLVANKQMQEAATVWEDILKQFPERSKKENVALNLVVSYEELKQFDKAITVLEGMRGEYPNPKFLDQRIERLKGRQYNQPGAQGWKR